MHNNIRSERVRVGKSVDEVALKIGVTSSSVLKWEAQITEPSGRNLIALASLFGCSPDYLLDMTDERHGRRNTANNLLA